MEKGYTYSDVLIKPNYSEIKTRTSVDLTTHLGNHEFKFPVISANMKNITGPKMAKEISDHGGLGLLHRFNSIEQALDDFDECGSSEGVGVSIGVQDEDKERFSRLYEYGARIFCIDVAHGHHILMKNMLLWINSTLSEEERRKVTIIAGNIATPEAYEDFIYWGADVAKVGIGPSPVCRTRYNTGVGMPQLYALEKICEKADHSPLPIDIIADGGISHVGDISKALAFSDAVMLGSMISGTSETPVSVFRNDEGQFYTVYGGSASAENKGENRFVEGIIKTTPFKGHVKYIFREIEQGLQSAFSYVGATNLGEFQENCEFIMLSGGSRSESVV